MHFVHGSNAHLTGISLLPLTSCPPISVREAVIEFALAVSTSLLDLAERKLGHFFASNGSLIIPLRSFFVGASITARFSADACKGG